MTEGIAPPWERLRRLAELSMLERRVHATQWADEITNRQGMDRLPHYLETAHRDMVAAVLLAVVEDGGSVGSASETQSRLSPQHEPGSSHPTDRHTNNVSPQVIRTWAQEQGIDVSERGRLPMWVTHRYYTEHAAASRSELAPGISSHSDGVPPPENVAAGETAENKVEDFLQALRGDSLDT